MDKRNHPIAVFSDQKWPFSNRWQEERELCHCCYRQVVNSFFDMESSKDIHVKRKIATCWYQWHDPFSHYSPLKWPLHTRNAMIMWILMLIGVSETFFNFKYNVALFLRVYMLIKSLVVFFRVHLEKNVALPIFLL